MATTVTDIDAYLADQPEKIKQALENLRQSIKRLVPGAGEVISYNIPAFNYHGVLVGFAAYKNHCGFYPMNGHTVEQFRDELKDFKTSKGTIQFTAEKPIPVSLLKKIIKARVKENIAKSGS